MCTLFCLWLCPYFLNHKATWKSIKQMTIRIYSFRWEYNNIISAKWMYLNCHLFCPFAMFFPENIYLFKVQNRNTRISCKLCSKLTIRTPEWGHWHLFGILIVNFVHILHLSLVFLLKTLSIYLLAGLLNVINHTKVAFVFCFCWFL